MPLAAVAWLVGRWWVGDTLLRQVSFGGVGGLALWDFRGLYWRRPRHGMGKSSAGLAGKLLAADVRLEVSEIATVSTWLPWPWRVPRLLP